MKEQPIIADLNTSLWVGSHRYRKILPEGVTECTNTLKASAKLSIECYPGYPSGVGRLVRALRDGRIAAPPSLTRGR